ncbi:hypothetical protein BJX68DRAFT_264973 [Aspergillus pseudodeflectus]|uniref:F-box domain-containing protein n=1 Tax=Aspergillus pseudodeflectus TaxID=176178 RepID=A0ABR4KML1_9EURO
MPVSFSPNWCLERKLLAKMEISFFSFPMEIIAITCGYLANSSLKPLRLSCKRASEIVPLHLNRVFLSANPLNISIFRSIAESEKFRYGVKEIIWDDARFISAPPEVPDPDSHHGHLQMNLKQGAPDWFVRMCRENIRFVARRARRALDVNRPAHLARVEQIATTSAIPTPPLKPSHKRCPMYAAVIP